MRAQVSLLVIALSILASCDTFESREYRVTRARAGDAARVQRILRDVAVETKIPHGTPTSADSPTIALYRDAKVQLRASLADRDIRVVLMRYDWPAPKAFTRGDALLVSALSSAFGGRFTSEPHSDAEVERTITVY
jgi:hypothetical protein